VVISSHGLKALNSDGSIARTGIPENSVGRLEQARSACGDRQQPAGTDQPPHFRGERRHVGGEEDAEHADNRVEVAGWHPGAGGVAVTELDIGQVLASGPGPGQVEQRCCGVDAKHVPGRADRAGRGNR